MSKLNTLDSLVTAALVNYSPSPAGVEAVLTILMKARENMMSPQSNTLLANGQFSLTHQPVKSYLLV